MNAPKLSAPAPRAKHLRPSDSGVHHINNVITALAAPTADREPEHVGRGLHSATRAASRLRAAAVFSAATADDTNLSLAAALDYRDEKQVRELRAGHRPLEIGHVLMLPAPERAAMAAAIIEARPDDAALARTVFLSWLTQSALERAERERDAGAIETTATTSDD